MILREPFKGIELPTFGQAKSDNFTFIIANNFVQILDGGQALYAPPDFMPEMLSSDASRAQILNDQPAKFAGAPRALGRWTPQ